MAVIKEYDENNNMIHYRSSTGGEWWRKYDEKGNVIHHRHANGYEVWWEYDENNNMIHTRNSTGYEYWYDKKGNLIHYRTSDGYEVWCEYDEKGNMIHYRNSDGDEFWYDENGNSIDAPPTPTQEHTMQIENTFTLIADYPGHAELTLSIPADCEASDFLRHCKTLAIGMGYHHTNWDDAILELAEEIQHMKKMA